ncbi:class I SAM-dependent methyltransferase [Pedobacter cryotolerans]|uniref:SAM-dependent methyltransferase n=1 Tax=Pedobacter cryotolerans TaxID=2571270 RepID=A0A4U1C4L0_9SPHI|nr:SAM-dependent methyltransferase [Pedobacter cryotolerans]TKB98201.1 SAM-dependent methyltransferase [Pedobacter cryotolerans]
MINAEFISEFNSVLSTSIKASTMVKLSLGNYNGNEKELKNIYIKKVKIKRADMLSFNYRYKTRDIFKNFGIDDGLKLVKNLLSNDFRIGTLFTVDEEVIIEHDKKGAIKLRKRALGKKLEVSIAHDKEKKRIIKPSNNPYLHALKITDAEGNVFKNAQDKYKQINQYIEILSSLIKELPEGTIKNVVDMGSGKGYLTFALYDYLHQQLNLKAKVTGVEFREDLVNLCNDIAKQADFKQLHFVEGTIEDYNVKEINLLIALHACDTATDDAIFKGIKAGAELIVVAPCCHKQIRREIEKHKVKNDVSFLTKYGIFLERQAEMVTDGIRALILEYYGYKTKVFEFISDAHTPKNVLVVGVKPLNPLKGTSETRRKEEILQKIKETKAYFGIDYHHLERLLDL